MTDSQNPENRENRENRDLAAAPDIPSDTASDAVSPSARALIARFKDRGLLGIFLLGMSAGFPLTVVFAISSAWLKDYGVSKAAIGFFALTGSFYSLKFLWSPLIDQVNFGALGRRFGQRRTWVVLMLAIISLVIFALAPLDPSNQLWTVGLLVAALALASSTLDIVVDALRIEWFDDKLQGAGATMYVWGYRIANYGAAYLALVMSDMAGWTVALSLMPIFALPGLLGIAIAGEPKGSAHRVARLAQQTQSIEDALRVSVYEPLKNFFLRPHALSILVFIFAFKLGDAFLDLMTTPFFKEVGFSNTDIANATKIHGAWALLVGVGAGGVLYAARSQYQSLLITTLLMMITNLGFALLADLGGGFWALAAVVAAEKFATGVAATVLVAYLSSLTSLAFTATQFALLSSFSTLGRTVLGSNGGWIAETIGWLNFFYLSTALGLPGLFMLFRLKRLGTLEGEPNEGAR